MDEEIQPQMSHNVTLFFTTDLEVEPLADQLGYALGASWDRSEHHDGTPSWYCRLLGIGVCFGPDSDESGFPFSLRLETGAGNLSRPFLYEFMAIVLHRVAHDLMDEHRPFEGVVYDDDHAVLARATIREVDGFPEVWLEPQGQALVHLNFFRDLWPKGFNWISEPPTGE